MKHSSILSGKPALSAGNIYIGKNGIMGGFDFDSGHYKPGIRSATLVYHFYMRSMSTTWNTTSVYWFGKKHKGGWSSSDCSTFDWANVNLPNYDSSLLLQSCYDLLASSQFRLVNY